MNNNLIIDKKKQKNIPQNSLSFFKIIKSDNWKNTVDLYIDIRKEIDYINLFIIMKSYLLSSIYPFTELIIRIKKNDESIVTERVNSSIFLKMSYYEFQKWSQYRINYDLKYYREGDFYSFSFISNSYLVKEEDLHYIKPDYPWKDEILNEIRSIEIKEIINLQNVKKQTALYLSTLNKQKEITKVLLENNADINIQDFRGNSPLMAAIMISKL